jgi:RNA polymerase sigma factor (sigma-70 family)
MTHRSHREQPATAEDSATIAALAERYGDAVKRFFSRRVRDRAAVEDLTQEVFARLLRRAGIDAIANIEGYLFSTAANLLKERARRAGARVAEAPLDETLVEQIEDFSPERILLGREALTRVVEALQELPERMRTVFILSRFEHLSGAEIARRLGISISSVEKDMMSAIAHLRARLA